MKLTYGETPTLTILTRDNRGKPQGVMIKKDYMVTNMEGGTLLLPTDYDNVWYINVDRLDKSGDRNFKIVNLNIVALGCN